jgi:hypothetical protein
VDASPKSDTRSTPLDFMPGKDTLDHGLPFSIIFRIQKTRWIAIFSISISRAAFSTEVSPKDRNRTSQAFVE